MSGSGVGIVVLIGAAIGLAMMFTPSSTPKLYSGGNKRKKTRSKRKLSKKR